MCQEVRSQQFHVIRFDVIAPLDGCIGFAGAIERQGATWAGAELNIGMLARGANNGQQVTLDLRLQAASSLRRRGACHAHRLNPSEYR